MDRWSLSVVAHNSLRSYKGFLKFGNLFLYLCIFMEKAINNNIRTYVLLRGIAKPICILINIMIK